MENPQQLLNLSPLKLNKCQIFTQFSCYYIDILSIFLFIIFSNILNKEKDQNLIPNLLPIIVILLILERIFQVSTYIYTDFLQNTKKQNIPLTQKNINVNIPQTMNPIRTDKMKYSNLMSNSNASQTTAAKISLPALQTSAQENPKQNQQKNSVQMLNNQSEITVASKRNSEDLGLIGVQNSNSRKNQKLIQYSVSEILTLEKQKPIINYLKKIILPLETGKSLALYTKYEYILLDNFQKFMPYQYQIISLRSKISNEYTPILKIIYLLVLITLNLIKNNWQQSITNEFLVILSTSTIFFCIINVGSIYAKYFVFKQEEKQFQEFFQKYASQRTGIYQQYFMLKCDQEIQRGNKIFGSENHLETEENENKLVNNFLNEPIQEVQSQENLGNLDTQNNNNNNNNIQPEENYITQRPEINTKLPKPFETKRNSKLNDLKEINNDSDSDEVNQNPLVVSQVFSQKCQKQMENILKEKNTTQSIQKDTEQKSDILDEEAIPPQKLMDISKKSAQTNINIDKENNLSIAAMAYSYNTQYQNRKRNSINQPQLARKPSQILKQSSINAYMNSTQPKTEKRSSYILKTQQNQEELIKKTEKIQKRQSEIQEIKKKNEKKIGSVINMYGVQPNTTTTSQKNPFNQRRSLQKKNSKTTVQFYDSGKKKKNSLGNNSDLQNLKKIKNGSQQVSPENIPVLGDEQNFMKNSYPISQDSPQNMQLENQKVIEDFDLNEN